MKRNTLGLTALGILFLMSSFRPAHAQAQDLQRIDYDYDLSSTWEYTSDDTISIYNTGLTFNAKDKSGASVEFRGAVDGKIDEIDSNNFELGTFVKELKVNYEIDNDNTVLLLSVGKMPTGAKIDRDNPRLVGGVMGVRLSIKPKKIPLVQKWLEKNGLKITRIDITRYDADSESRLEINDLEEMDMTSYAVYLSKGKNLHTFFIHKRPDRDNQYGVTSTTLGAAYMLPGRYKPQLFGMTHQSVSSFMELDLLVLSAGAEVRPGIQSTFSYSYATESKSSTEKESYDLSFSKTLFKGKKVKVKGILGGRVQRGDQNDEIIYMRIEAKY